MSLCTCSLRPEGCSTIIVILGLLNRPRCMIVCAFITELTVAIHISMSSPLKHVWKHVTLQVALSLYSQQGLSVKEYCITLDN